MGHHKESGGVYRAWRAILLAQARKRISSRRLDARNRQNIGGV